jgi:hypothetical protein
VRSVLGGGIALVVAAALTWGCQADRGHDAPAPPLGSALPSARGSSDVGSTSEPPTMAVIVADVHAEPGVDRQAIRSTLRDAEAALLACLDEGGSTGVITLSFPIEHDGAVGDIVESSKTTYGSEAARLCIERLVSALRFPRDHANGRSEVEITLEVSPRR